MIDEIELQVTAFLRNPVKPLPADQARKLLEHAAFCDDCAKALKVHPFHSEALLESLHPAPAWTPTEREVVKGVQEEIVFFGDAVLERLKSTGDFHKFRGALDLPLSREQREEFWAVEQIDSPRLHIALGCTAIKLTVGSWLASAKESPARAELSFDGLNVSGKMVPDSVFAERIEDYAAVPPALAARTWDAGKHVAIDRKVGIPGTYWMSLRPGSIGLTLSARGLERWRASLPR